MVVWVWEYVWQVLDGFGWGGVSGWVGVLVLVTVVVWVLKYVVYGLGGGVSVVYRLCVVRCGGV